MSSREVDVWQKVGIEKSRDKVTKSEEKVSVLALVMRDLGMLVRLSTSRTIQKTRTR